MLDARGGLIYCGVFRLTPGGERIETLIPGGARPEDEFMAEAEAAIAAAGEANPAHRLHAEPGSKPVMFTAAGSNPGSEPVMSAAAAESAAAKPSPIRRLRDSDEPQSALHTLKWALAFGEPIHYAELAPVYMRKAEARRKLEERLAAQGRRPPDGIQE
jgi:tRNA A37 threonylcarbamoyladenosine modification protein TsaB